MAKILKLPLEYHSISEIFPLLPDEELKELAEDIGENGLRVPILIYEGKILDRRNRYRAMQLIPDYLEEGCLDQEEYREYLPEVDGDPTKHILSLNLHRRHLDESQRAMVAARLANSRQGERTDLSEPSANLRKVSQVEAAELVKVSPRSVTSAKKVLESGDSELVAAVDRGEVPVSAAAKSLQPEPPRSWTAPEVSTEEKNKVGEEAAKSSAGKEPMSPTKNQAISRLKRFIRETCELLKIPKKEIEEYIKEYLLTKDKHP